MMEVELAKEGTALYKFQKERTDAIGEMFDNPDEYGIYPTGEFFARLDGCVKELLLQARKCHHANDCASHKDNPEACDCDGWILDIP